MTTTEKLNKQYVEVPTADTDKKFQDIPPDFGCGVRHIQLIIFFICVGTSFITRGHLSVTIVAMTSPNHNANNLTNNSTVKSDVLASRNHSMGLEDLANKSHMNDSIVLTSRNGSMVLADPGRQPVYATYDWPKPIQETVLSSFFLGYCLGTFPAALVCQRWGGKIPLQVNLLVNSAVSLLTPWLTLWGGWKAVSACRVVQGLAQAGTYPGIQTLLAKWAPINERATMTSYVYTGSTIGNIIGFQVSGILAESWGWAVNFWAVGAVCLICFVFLTVLGSSTPQAHSTISEEEKRYILGHSDTTVALIRRPAPWKAILSSGRVWATFITHIGSGTSYIFLMTQIPSFTHYILGVNVKSSGLLSSLPYLASFFASCGFGLFSDYLTNKNFISIKTARRLFNSISQVGVMVALVGASFATSTAAAVTCFVFAVSCHTAVHAGWMVNHIDLTPEYGGTLMACGNTLMNVVVLLMPVVVSNVVVDVRNAFQWHIMLWLVAGLCFITNIVFVLFVSVDVQPWNDTAGVDDDAASKDGLSIKEKAERTNKDF